MSEIVFHQIATQESIRIEGERPGDTMRVVGPWTGLRDKKPHMPGRWVNEHDGSGNIIGGGVKGRQVRRDGELMVYVNPINAKAERERRGIPSRR